MLMNYWFAAHEALLHLRNALNQYPNPDLLREINELIALVQNRKFIVAVVGEFNRGKSSLINALLGMPILPMDILPTTATANRIVYGLAPGVQILGKDGSRQKINVDELAEYVTKLTDESQQNAKNIQETMIEYPIPLCQNGVEILDTPGLNDTVEMENITNGILRDTHAVVFAVSATMPLSESEADWIAGMIQSERLQYLMFVVTFFDRVAKRDQQKVLAHIRGRISTMVQQRAEELYPEQPELLEKAKRMTTPETMFLMPVSARDALDAFDLGDDELLQKSNLPQFKQALMTALTAQQDEYAFERTRELLRRVEAWLHASNQQMTRIQEAQNLRENCNKALLCLQNYADAVNRSIQGLCTQIEAAVKTTPDASVSMREAANRAIQVRMGSIRTNDDVHNTLHAATLAAREAAKAHYLGQWKGEFLEVFSDQVALIEAEHEALLEKCRNLLGLVPQLQETLELKKKLWSRMGACLIPELPSTWNLDITGGFLKGVVTGGQRMAEDIGKTVRSAADFMEEKSTGFRKMKGKFESFMQKSGILEKVENIELPQLEIKEGLLTGRNLYLEISPKISEGTTHLILAWNGVPKLLAAILKAVYLDEEGLLTDATLQLALTKRKGEADATLKQRIQVREENFKDAMACLEEAAKSLKVHCESKP